MKFVVDENLPQALAVWLANAGHDAVHVAQLGLLGADDSKVWEHCAALGAFVISRDGDFIDLASRDNRCGVVRLRIGNCSTAVLLARVETLWPDVEKTLTAGQRVIETG